MVTPPWDVVSARDPERDLSLDADADKVRAAVALQSEEYVISPELVKLDDFVCVNVSSVDLDAERLEESLRDKPGELVFVGLVTDSEKVDERFLVGPESDLDLLTLLVRASRLRV